MQIDVLSYHQRSKHGFQGYAKGPEMIDWDSQPDPFRRFEGAPEIRLPLAADAVELPFSALSKPKPVPARPLNLDNLAILLEISLALSAWKQHGATRWSMRCNPSSGNLHPTEAYLLVSGIAGLDDGVYHYRSDRHMLERRCRFNSPPAVADPRLLIGFSSVYWREAWKYGERAFRYCQHDVGHAMAAVNYAAAVLGWQALSLRQAGDTAVERLLGLDRKQDFAGAEAESADLLLQINTAPASPEAIEPWLQRAANGDWQGQASVLDKHHCYDWPVIEAIAAACRKPDSTDDGSSSGISVAADALPAPIASECREAATKLIRSRRSAQAFDGNTKMALDDFYRLLDHVLPRPTLPPWPVQMAETALHLVFFVHRVSGLAPGLYALARSESGLDLMRRSMRAEFAWSNVADAPPHLKFYQLVTAKAERTATKLSCLQPIAGDSAFSLAMLAEFDNNIESAPWRYRELFWQAGILGQALYLEAEAIGLRGTGIGCFFDDPVHELLGIQDSTMQSLYHFTIGTPVTDMRIISLPPYGSHSVR